MDGGAWWVAVHGVAKSWTRLSNFTFTFHFHALEKEMATHSSVLAWRIPEKGEPGGLPSMGSHKVKHDWGDLAAAAYSAFLLFFIAATFYFPDFLFQFFKLFSVLGSWRRERRTLKLLLHIWFSFIPKFIFMFWVELFPPKIYMIKP